MVWRFFMWEASRRYISRFSFFFLFVYSGTVLLSLIIVVRSVFLLGLFLPLQNDWSLSCDQGLEDAMGWCENSNNYNHQPLTAEEWKPDTSRNQMSRNWPLVFTDFFRSEQSRATYQAYVLLMEDSVQNYKCVCWCLPSFFLTADCSKTVSYSPVCWGLSVSRRPNLSGRLVSPIRTSTDFCLTIF